MSKLVYEIKSFKGFVLGVGNLKDKIIKEIEKNDYIEVDLLTNESVSINKKKKFVNIDFKKKKGKSVSIKKLKKVFKNKRPDYIICNIDDVYNYTKYFIKDSMYITNNSIYVYSESKNIDLKEIEKKYKRYIDNVEYNDDYIVINTTNYHSHIFKNMWYFIVDIFTAIYDYIGNLLAG